MHLSNLEVASSQVELFYSVFVDLLLNVIYSKHIATTLICAKAQDQVNALSEESLRTRLRSIGVVSESAHASLN